MNQEWTSYSDFYEHVGRFAVDFEQGCHAMEVCIRNILDKSGLTDPGIQEVLLAAYNADALRALLQNLLGQTIKFDKDEKDLCSRALNKVQKLISKRNDVIHGKWFMLTEIDDNKNENIRSLGYKLHANSSGSSTKDIKKTKNEMQNLIDLCKEARTIVSLLTRCVIGIRKISECFEIKGDQLEIKKESLIIDEINV